MSNNKIFFENIPETVVLGMLKNNGLVKFYKRVQRHKQKRHPELDSGSPP